MIAAVETQGELFRNRAGHASLDFDLVEVAVACLDIATQFELGLLRGDVQRTGRGVAAEKRALRSAQHFNALDRGQFSQRHTGARTEYAIDKHANSRFKTGVVASGTDTADRQYCTGCRRLAGCGLQRRGKLLDAANVNDTGIGKLFAADNAHRQWHVLGGLVTAGCGNDDFVIGISIFGRLFGLDFAILGERRRCRRDKHGSADKQHMYRFHDVPL